MYSYRHPMLRAYISTKPGSTPHPITGDELYWFDCLDSSEELAKRVFSSRVVNIEKFDKEWENQLEIAINAPEFPPKGPLWM